MTSRWSTVERTVDPSLANVKFGVWIKISDEASEKVTADGNRWSDWPHLCGHLSWARCIRTVADRINKRLEIYFKGGVHYRCQSCESPYAVGWATHLPSKKHFQALSTHMGHTPVNVLKPDMWQLISERPWGMRERFWIAFNHITGEAHLMLRDDDDPPHPPYLLIRF